MLVCNIVLDGCIDGSNATENCIVNICKILGSSQFDNLEVAPDIFVEDLIAKLKAFKAALETIRLLLERMKEEFRIVLSLHLNVSPSPRNESDVNQVMRFIDKIVAAINRL